MFELGAKSAIVAAVTMFIGSVVTGIYGVYLLVELIVNAIKVLPDIPANFLSTHIILIIDIQLLSMIQYVISVGLYELFIGELKLPKWLSINNIEELKAKLASVIILILAVKFTEKAMQWKGGIDIMYLAIAIGVIIFVLTAYYKAKGSKGENSTTKD